MDKQETTVPDRKRNLALLAIFAASAAIKSAICILATDPIIFNKYPYFAQKLSSGADIGERILDLSPLYLFLVKIFFEIFGPNWDILTALQIILGSFNCVIVGLVGARLFNPAVGILSALILMLYGNMTLIECAIEPEGLFIFLNSLTVLALLWAAGDKTSPPHPAKWLPGGILIGLAAVAKANALLIIPGAAVWIWLSTKERRIRSLTLLLLGAALVIAPVTIRNFCLFDDFVLLTADGGKVFFHGNGPGATGMERADMPDQGLIEEGQTEPDYAHALFRQKAREATKTSLKPSECSSYWFSQTQRHLLAAPKAALSGFLKKFLLFWNNYEVHDLDTTYKSYKIIGKWPFLTAGIIAAAGILGMIFSAGMLRRFFLLYWMVAIYIVSVVVFFAASRYRLPAFNFLAIFAAGFLYELYVAISGKKLEKTIVAFLLIPVFLAFTHLPFRDEIRKYDLWQHISRIDYSLGGRMLFKKGNFPEAAREFEKVVSAAPDFVPAVNYLGKTCAILGNYDCASDCFRKVIRLAPASDEGYLNAGLLLELRGNKREARRYFEKAQALNPRNVKTRDHLNTISRE